MRRIPINSLDFNFCFKLLNNIYEYNYEINKDESVSLGKTAILIPVFHNL